MVNLEIITFMKKYKYLHKLTCIVTCFILKDSFKLMSWISSLLTVPTREITLPDTGILIINFGHIQHINT